MAEKSFKERLLERLNSPYEKEIERWSLALQHKSRKGRADELRKKGILK